MLDQFLFIHEVFLFLHAGEAGDLAALKTCSVERSAVSNRHLIAGQSVELKLTEKQGIWARFAEKPPKRLEFFGLKSRQIRATRLLSQYMLIFGLKT
jgi:hypothetical protein